MSGLTEKEREWRAEMSQALGKAREAIMAINGPYRETATALRLFDQMCEVAIDDEDIGPCIMCEEPIWIIAGDRSEATEDGEPVCQACVERWKRDAAQEGEVV